MYAITNSTNWYQTRLGSLVLGARRWGVSQQEEALVAFSIVPKPLAFRIEC